MITKTEAVVLRSVDYSESSLIVTLFTRKHGITAVIAKGAKRPKSKFAALLVPGQVLEVVFYMKSTRSVQTLSEASFMLKLNHLRTDVEKMALAVTTMELVKQVVHDNEVNEPLFAFVVKMLRWIDGAENVSKKIFPYIQMRVLASIGIGLQQGDPKNEEVVDGYMNIESGTLSRQSEGDTSVRLTPVQFRFLIECLKRSGTSILKMDLKNSELSELIEYLDRYIRYHVEGVKPRRSDEIFDQILR